MFKRFISILTLFSVLYLSQATKYWITDEPALNFTSPEFWYNRNPPCSMDTIVFPENYPAAILTPTNLKVNGLILPFDGAVILRGPVSTMSFTDGATEPEGHKCVNLNHLAKIISVPPKVRYWFDPENWSTSSEIGSHSQPTKRNPATPHVERIPCSNEKAVLNYSVGPITLDLDRIDILELGGFHFGGVDVSSEAFESGLFTDLAHVIFKNADDIQVRYLDRNTCGCHRPEMVIRYNINVCQHTRNLCVEPKCVDPISPIGHCCEICGSMVKLIIDDCQAFNLKRFKELIDKSITDQNMVNKLDFDATIIDDGIEKYIQLIIIDRGEYKEYSTDFLHNFNKSILQEAYSKLKQTYYMSGYPYDKANIGTAWKYIYVPFLAVIVFLFIAYVYYVPENPYIRLPPWLYTGRYNLFNAPFVFARFDNSQPDGVSVQREDNLVMNVDYEQLRSPERRNQDNDEHADGGGNTSFDNPMFKDDIKDEPAIKDFGTVNDTELTEICLEGRN